MGSVANPMSVVRDWNVLRYLLECTRESRGKNATQLLVNPSTRDS